MYRWHENAIESDEEINQMAIDDLEVIAISDVETEEFDTEILDADLNSLDQDICTYG